MKTKLIELATSKQIGFTSQMFTDTNWKHSIKEDLRYYLWMCELQKWCREKHSEHTFIWYNTLTEQYRIESGSDSKKIYNPFKEFITYEQALEEGLYQTLLLIQEKNGKEN